MDDNRSLWDATAPPTTRPPLTGEHETDVLVIGGGVAGATIALRLLREGRRVTLLEAEQVGRGATAYSTVKVTAAQALRGHEISRTHGDDGAIRYLRASLAAVGEIATLVAELNIACDHESRHHVVFAETEQHLDALRHELELEQAAGMPVAWLANVDLPFPVKGALVAADQAQLHPLRYVQGLVDAFERDGGQVFEGTRVTEVEGGAPCIARFESGVARAADVVIATHYPIVDAGMLSARLDPQHEYAVAGPIDDDRAPAETYISIESPTRSLRTARDADGRSLLIVVGERHKVGEGGDTGEYYRALERWAAERFGVTEIVYRWSTQDPFTLDGLPMIGPLSSGSNHLWTSTGFGAWGMTNGTIAGRVLTDLIAGREHPDADLFSLSRADAARGFPTFVSMNAKIAMHWIGDRLSTDADDVQELSPGEAAIVDTPERKVAAYRDDADVLHAVSAVCTHMGCVVEWNGVETSWDCPCHGSRFGVDGDVIEPPATAPLDPVDR